MYDMTRLETVTSGNLCVAGFAASQSAAFGQQFRPRRPMDGAVHSSPSQKTFIGRVDDGVHVHCRNVVPN